MSAPSWLTMLIASAVLIVGTPVAAQDTKLTIASWGGAYAQSQKIAYFQPFQKETGISIASKYHGGQSALLGKGRSYRFQNWDVVDLSADALLSACRDGLLETISPAGLTAARDGTSANDDFLPGALTDCGVASVAWSSIIVYDKRAFDGKQPKTVADFFDIKQFPGKRVLRRGAKYTLELALLGDGVAPENVYAELATEQGVKRAFGVLERIKDDIIWWDGSEDHLKLLAESKAVMAMAFNARAFGSLMAENRSLAILWHGQLYTMNSWAIPKTSRNKTAARRFIDFSTKPDRLAQQAKWFPYGPVRKSALAMVGDHAEIDVTMSGYLPTSDANLSHALQVDAGWWLTHGDGLEAKFKQWLATNGASLDATVRTSSTKGDDDKKEATVAP
jgi:putative spermidine/putrescine transport system substrate-binding protein